jgi:hypothetical protein
MRKLCICFAVIGILGLASSGCKRRSHTAYAPYTGKTTDRPAENVGKVFPAVGRAVDRQELVQIGELYVLYWMENPRGPSRVEDFDLERLGDRKLLKMIKDGDLVVVWNVGENNTNCQILGYQKITPTQGGLVVRRDCSVNSVTAEEFKEHQKTFPPQK